MYAMTAAHKNLPLPTYVKVTNLDNGKSIIVKVNDRGPFHENRIIDLSYTAAIKLDIVKKGTGLVEVRALKAGEPLQQTTKSAAPVTTNPIQSDNSGFYIQVGSFGELANAEKMRQKISSIDEQLVKINQTVVDGRTLYRVRIGPITDIDVSDSITTQLENMDISEHRIVTN